MYDGMFSAERVAECLEVLKNEFPFAIWETFYITVLSTFFAILLGLPLGVLLTACKKDGIMSMPKGLKKALGLLLNIPIDLLRAIPFLILMILVLPISRAVVGTSVGTMATLIPLVFAAAPFVARLVETSLMEVDPNILEAAQSMGATPFQIVTKVMIPESVPSLISNFTVAITTILGYSAMSAAIGGGGLGKIAINYGYYRYKYLIMICAMILLVVMVLVFQAVGSALAKAADKRKKDHSK